MLKNSFKFIVIFLLINKIDKLMCLNNNESAHNKLDSLKSSNNLILKKIKFTYGFSGGRLGDNLISFIRARWLAYIYEGEVILNNFKFIENFNFYNKYKKNNNYIPILSLKEIGKEFENKNHNELIYEVPYFPFENLEIKLYWRNNLSNKIFEIDWSDEKFINILKEEISSNLDYNLYLTKNNKYNIAIHYRFGSGPDMVTDDPIPIPSKSPSIDFYIKSLFELTNILKDKQIYCHLLKKSFPKINFGYHSSNENNGVLEDFFSMLDFEYIIRPCSNLSLIASIIGKCHTVLMPINQNSENKINKIGFYSEKHKCTLKEAFAIPTKVGFAW